MDTRPGSLWPLLLAALLLIAGLALADSRAQQALRNFQFDQFQRWRPRSYAPVPVRIVDIDEASLARLGQWPWPRSRMAELLERLTAAGASVVAFDMLFAEPDRTAPQAMAALWKLQGPQRAALLALPDHDSVFVRALEKSPSVIGFALQPAPRSAPAALPLQKARLVEVGQAQPAWLHAFHASVPSLPAFEQAAWGNGALSFVADADGLVRRVPLLLQLDQTLVPTLVTEALRVAQGERNLLLHNAGQNSGLAELRIGRLRLPTTPQGELWLHYSAPVAARTLPAWQVLDGALPAGQWAGQMVLVGSSAQGLMDMRFGPLGPLPGVEVHAQALEQALSGHFLQRPSWARGLEALLLLLGCTLVGALALGRRALLSAAASLCLLLALAGGAWWAFVAQGLLLDAATPALGLLLTYLLCSLWQHRQRERQQRWTRQAFARYVSPNRVAHLLAHPQDLVLGGRRQQCSFVFTDLTGFTPWIERQDPEQVVGLLNTYLDAMVAIAFRLEGTLDRIVGDALVIMFSAPLEQADHRARALACALEMEAFARGYARLLQQRGTPFCQTRIGAHSGEVIVGNFGGKTLFDYRALGDPVNTAARLERVNKQLGTRICVSEAILAGAPQVPARPVGLLQLQGKSQALAVFEPVTHDDTARAPLADYQAAYESMRQWHPEALKGFTRLAQAWPDDPLVRLHQRRLAAGARGDYLVMSEK